MVFNITPESNITRTQHILVMNISQHGYLTLVFVADKQHNVSSVHYFSTQKEKADPVKGAAGHSRVLVLPGQRASVLSGAEVHASARSHHAVLAEGHRA